MQWLVVRRFVARERPAQVFDRHILASLGVEKVLASAAVASSLPQLSQPPLQIHRRIHSVLC